MDGRAWWAVAHGVAKSRTRLSDFTYVAGTILCYYIHYLFLILK